MKRYHILIALVLMLGLSSCLKENPALDSKDTNNVVEIYNPIPTPTTSPADAVYPAYAKAFEIVPTGEYIFYVSYSGADVAPQDITVKLALDDGARADYNDDQGTAYVKMPLSVYSFETMEPVIKKGERVTPIKITFKPDQFDPSVTYALPVKITSTSFGTISGNFGTVLFLISAKNKYDGRYKVTGTLTDANGVYRGVYPVEIWLTTTNANSCDYINSDYEFYYYLLQNISTGGLAYLYYPKFVFDLNTDKVINIVWADDGTPVSGMAIDPVLNQYVFPDRSLHLKYQVGTRWTIEEFFEYLGPRP